MILLDQERAARKAQQHHRKLIELLARAPGLQPWDFPYMGDLDPWIREVREYCIFLGHRVSLGDSLNHSNHGHEKIRPNKKIQDSIDWRYHIMWV